MHDINESGLGILCYFSFDFGFSLLYMQSIMEYLNLGNARLFLFFSRKIFIRKWASKTQKPHINVKKISNLKCWAL